MKIPFIIGLLFLITASAGLSAQNTKEPSSYCDLLKEGSFTYGPARDSIKVVIKGNKHTETHNNGKYTIESTLEWVNDCEYNTTLLSADLPDFPFKAGAVMNVKVIKVKGREIYYTSTVNGQSWPGKFTKLD